MGAQRGVLAARPRCAVSAEWPTATPLVNSEVCVSSKANSDRNAGMTAVTENHSASAMTSHTAKSAIESHFVQAIAPFHFGQGRSDPMAFPYPALGKWRIGSRRDGARDESESDVRRDS